MPEQMPVCMVGHQVNPLLCMLWKHVKASQVRAEKSPVAEVEPGAESDLEKYNASKQHGVGNALKGQKLTPVGNLTRCPHPSALSPRWPEGQAPVQADILYLPNLRTGGSRCLDSCRHQTVLCSVLVANQADVGRCLPGGCLKQTFMIPHMPKLLQLHCKTGLSVAEGRSHQAARFCRAFGP